MLILSTQNIEARVHQFEIYSLSERCLLSVRFDVRSSFLNIDNFQPILLLAQRYTGGYRAEVCQCLVTE